MAGQGTEASRGAAQATVPLSRLLGRVAAAADGQGVGHVVDVVVRLRDREGGGHPRVTGLVLRVGKHGPLVFLPIGHVASMDGATVALVGADADIRPFRERPAEVLLRSEVLGRRLIDVRGPRFVRAADLELERRDGGWVLSGVDVRGPADPARFLTGRRAPRVYVDWTMFEPLIGRDGHGRAHLSLLKTRRLKPPQIADLLEDASKAEEHEILADVRTDPELEADVFEELHPDLARRLLRDRSDAQIAAVLARMQADDAADTLAELPQPRRQPVLDLLPESACRKITALLGFHPTSAGGLMGVDLLAVGPRASCGEAVAAVAAARHLPAAALCTVHVLDEERRLLGAVPVVAVLQADADLPLDRIADPDPVTVGPDADMEDAAILMADYNLITLPVVDGRRRLLGVITVDDLLAETIPESWRRRAAGAESEAEPPR